MKDFDTYLENKQVEWRGLHVVDKEHGTQNGVRRAWILPSEVWEKGLWVDIRDRIPKYIEKNSIQKHRGAHNLKSSWMHCANLYFPFGEVRGRVILAEFLRAQVSPEIASVEGLELEYAEQSPLDPQTLLGESAAGKRGANQTSPDIAFIVRTKDGGRGLILTENKLAEHSFYSCSGRKPDVENPDATRCMNWAKVQHDPGGECWQMAWEQPDRPNRTYWKHIRLSVNGKQALTRCPAATAGYQLFRQQALAEAFAASGHYQLVASCVAYDARNDDLRHSLRGTGVGNFAIGWGQLFAGRALFATWTHQEWVSWVRKHDMAKNWVDWLDYVDNRYGYFAG